MILLLLKENGYFRLFLPSWAGKDVAPVPPGDGSSSVSAVEISDWLTLPFVSLQYMSTWLLLEFEEVFGAHSSPGCFFGMSVRKIKEGLGVCHGGKSLCLGCSLHFKRSHPRFLALHDHERQVCRVLCQKVLSKKKSLANVCEANFKECISPFQLDTSLSEVKQLSLSRLSRTSSTSL